MITESERKKIRSINKSIISNGVVLETEDW